MFVVRGVLLDANIEEAGQDREEIAHVDISEPNSPTNHH